MKIQIYSHRNGTKIVSDQIFQEVVNTIENYHPYIGANCARKLRTGLYALLGKKGWTGELKLDTNSNISIGSFYKGIGLNIQTGNAGRIYADLLKMQTLYVKGKINCGIIITPMATTANNIGKCMATFERLTRELPIFSPVITMPIIVIGFSGD